MTQDILFDVRGGLGLITLNRPQALNALTLEMIRLMDSYLREWQSDDQVKAVAIYGETARAFCAGGDIKAMALDVRQGGDLAEKFFRAEYSLNALIHSYGKPYIVLADGIAMGGGVGISAQGSHRVVTENVSFAMPETSIGFFPDVGSGYFLPRCPGQVGTLLGLTGRRVCGPDNIYIGYATHFVPAEKMLDLMDALSTINWDRPHNFETQINNVINDLIAPAPGDSDIARHRSVIDSCFGFDTVAEIIGALEEADQSDFTHETLSMLYGASPTSLAITLKHLRTCEPLSFGRVMQQEYRISQRIVDLPDFYEGVRATLIDKDKTPKWCPTRLDGVDYDIVEACFAPLDNDLDIG